MLRYVKRVLLVGSCLLCVLPVIAQTSSSSVKKAPASKSAGLSPEKSQMLCKAWKLDSLSEYGVDNKAAGKQANDGVTFVADGSLFLTLDGVASSGTWTYASGRITMITKSPDNTYTYKVIVLSDKSLMVDFQYPAPDLTRVRFTYSPKK